MRSLVKKHQIKVKVSAEDRTDIQLAVRYESRRRREKVYAAQLFREISMERIRVIAELERRKLSPAVAA